MRTPPTGVTARGGDERIIRSSITAVATPRSNQAMTALLRSTETVRFSTGLKCLDCGICEHQDDGNEHLFFSQDEGKLQPSGEQHGLVCVLCGPCCDGAQGGVKMEGAGRSQGRVSSIRVKAVLSQAEGLLWRTKYSEV